MVSLWRRCVWVIGILGLGLLARGKDPGRLPDLTEEERAWIKAHPVIRVVTLEDYAPYLITQPNGQLAGLSVNLIDVISRRTGLRFEYRKHSTVDSALADFKSGGGDVLPALARNAEREAFALFSTPYSTGFAVLVTRTDSPYINSLPELGHRRVGVLRGAIHGQQIKAAAPDSQLVEYNTTQESLIGLAAGEVEATFATVGTAAYYIKHLQLANLRLGSVVSETTPLHVGVRKDWPELVSLIDRSLASISPAERKSIDDQWIFVAQPPNRWLPWLRVMAVIAALAILIAALLFYFYRRLQRELEERRRIQAELEQAYSQLARVSEEKSEIMSSIAHDLRSPLTGLTLGSGLLQAIVEPSNQAAHEMIAHQRDACAKLIAQVDELVHPHVHETGRRALKWTEVDLVTVLQEAFASCAGSAKAKEITLELDTAAPRLAIRSDKGALQHVVDNLLSNAIKYSPHGRPVRVELRREGAELVMHFIDQGPGVPAAERDTIFKRFSRGSARPTGGESSTGLGLWIVRRTLDELQGRVSCGPGRDGRGTTFSVWLPEKPAGEKA